MQNIRLDTGVDNYCVVGNPVTHSKSPLIHMAFAAQTGQKIYYQKIEANAGEFLSVLNEFQKQGGKGMNITIPFKEEACTIADVLTARAEHANAVNTLWFDQEGKRYGDNTDGCGLITDLSINHNITIEGMNVLILGAGGSVRGILDPLFDQSPASIVIANRTVSRAEKLADIFSDRHTLIVCGYEDLPGQTFNLVINATSTSLQGTVPPLPDGVLSPDACCYDLMYSDSDTAFVKWSKQHHAAKALDGTGMLVEQAAESFFIWRGIRPETKPVIEMLKTGDRH